jgi:hypothetical protein
MRALSGLVSERIALEVLVREDAVVRVLLPEELHCLLWSCLSTGGGFHIKPTYPVEGC